MKNNKGTRWVLTKLHAGTVTYKFETVYFSCKGKRPTQKELDQVLDGAVLICLQRIKE